MLNLSRDRGEDFQFVLTKYAIERILFAVGGGLLLHPGWLTDGIGIIIAGAAIFSHLVLNKAPALEAAGAK